MATGVWESSPPNTRRAKQGPTSSEMERQRGGIVCIVTEGHSMTQSAATIDPTTEAPAG